MVKKWPVVFLCITIIAVTSFEGCIQIDSSNYRDSDGLTSAGKLKAIDIVLGNGEVKGYISGQELNTIYVKEVTLSGLNESPGYINATGRIVQVLMEYPNYIGKEKILALVDLDTGKAMDVEWYSYRGGLPMHANATIPPGACWYHPINIIKGYYGTGGDDLVFFIKDFTPGNTTIYPMIVDENNLNKMKNGSAYTAAGVMNVDTGGLTTINGSEPITRPWLKNISAISEPSSNISRSYYLVLYNSDKTHNAIVSYWA